MDRHVQVLYISHAESSLEERSKLSFHNEEIDQFYSYLEDKMSVDELLILSTCNRTEFYFSSTQTDCSKKLITLISAYKGLQSSETALLFHHTTGNEAIRRLFRITIGLESQVLGDFQIINQIKSAYEIAINNDKIQGFFHRLLHTAFHLNKRITNETALKDGVASVSYATLQLVQDIIKQSSKEQKILIVGLGESGVTTCRTLISAEITNFTITNRTASKSKQIAEELTLQYIPFNQLDQGILESDIIISAVSTNEEIIHPTYDIKNYAQKKFIDLSVPGCVSDEIKECSTVFTMDHIQTITSNALAQRKSEIPYCEHIIEEEIATLVTWKEEASALDAIRKFKDHLEVIKKEELSRLLHKASEKDLELAELISGRIIQKIIKSPVISLKSQCSRDRQGQNLTKALYELFDLEKQYQLNKIYQND